MPISVIPGFLIYCYIGAITPGPANICSLSAAARYGRRAALRQWWGLFVGFAIVSFSSVAVSLLIGNAFSEYIGIFSVIGAAYVMYMAVNTLRGSSIQGKGDLARPTFRKGILIELTNVKVMIYCLTAMTGYVLPNTDSIWVLLLVGAFMPFTGPLGNLVWIFAGGFIKRIYEKHARAVDICMAIALAACAVSMLI